LKIVLRENSIRINSRYLLLKKKSVVILTHYTNNSTIKHLLATIRFARAKIVYVTMRKCE